MLFEFKFPDIGEGVHEGRVLQLKARVGDVVEAGRVLAVVETDKVVAEIPAPRSGTITRLNIAEGQIIKVGEVLAVLDPGALAPAETLEASPVGENAGVVGRLEEAGDLILPATGEGVGDFAPESTSLFEDRKKVRATPVARKIAAELGLDLAKIRGTGPAGRVLKQDLLALARPTHARAPHPHEARSVSRPSPDFRSPRPLAGDATIPFTSLRATVARRMEESQAIPTAVVHDFAVIDDLVRFREKVNGRAAPKESRLSFLPFFLKAVALAVAEFPQVNSTLAPGGGAYIVHHSVHLGFALEGPDGLLVPVLRDLGNLTIREIADSMATLVARAKARQLNLEDLAGGTLTVTNYGSIAGIYARPMILPPQVAIIGFGRVHLAPVVIDAAVRPGWILPVSLAFDHRVIDGAPAGLFLKRLLGLLAEPEEMILSMR